MPTPEDVKDETALAKWMERFRVTNRELGARAGIHENYLGTFRAGSRRPGDKLKIAIHEATRAIESELGVAEPIGVAPGDWFTPAEVDELKAKRAAAGAR